MIVRIIHTGICMGIMSVLLWKDTVLHHALIDLQDPIYGVLFCCLLAVSLVLYFVTCFTDPGYVPKQKLKTTGGQDHCLEMESDMSEVETCLTQDAQPLDKRHRYKYRFCDYCEIQPPLRAKHCEDCRLCVRRYDHHCPWLEACVGERNHKYFWWFLLVTAVLIVWTFVILWDSFVTKKSWTEWFHTNLVLFLLAIILVISGPVVLGLLAFHTYLMINGQTTWEASSRERITYLKYLENEFNPFDEGCLSNIYYFMCFHKVRRWEQVYAQKAKFTASQD